jgi:hypothetical protein
VRGSSRNPFCFAAPEIVALPPLIRKPSGRPTFAESADGAS